MSLKRVLHSIVIPQQQPSNNISSRMSNNTSSLPTVLVVGATGATGGSIVKGLLASGNFVRHSIEPLYAKIERNLTVIFSLQIVTALVRPTSQSKPATQALRTSGVEIRIGDLTDGVAKLKDTLAGVDIVISAVVAWSILAQKDLIRAAKEVGVKRIVPCDFGTPGKRGVRELTDEVHPYLKSMSDLTGC